MTCKAEKNELINDDFCKYLERMHLITSTSGTIECVFSLFGLVWLKLFKR